MELRMAVKLAWRFSSLAVMAGISPVEVPAAGAGFGAAFPVAVAVGVGAEAGVSGVLSSCSPGVGATGWRLILVTVGSSFCGVMLLAGSVSGTGGAVVVTAGVSPVIGEVACALSSGGEADDNSSRVQSRWRIGGGGAADLAMAMITPASRVCRAKVSIAIFNLLSWKPDPDSPPNHEQVMRKLSPDLQLLSSRS